MTQSENQTICSHAMHQTVSQSTLQTCRYLLTKSFGDRGTTLQGGDLGASCVCMWHHTLDTETAFRSNASSRAPPVYFYGQIVFHSLHIRW